MAIHDSERGETKAYRIARLQGSFDDLLPIHERTVTRAKITDLEQIILHREQAMCPANPVILQV